MQFLKKLSRKQWIFCGLVTAALLLGGGYSMLHGFSTGTVEQDGELPVGKGRAKAKPVKVVQPRAGGMDRTTTQPCSLLAFESVELQAAVSGYLKTLNVDIGSKVKKDQVLAEIEVPELVKQLQHQKAVVEQASARVYQMMARKDATTAELWPPRHPSSRPSLLLRKR